MDDDDDQEQGRTTDEEGAERQAAPGRSDRQSVPHGEGETSGEPAAEGDDVNDPAMAADDLVTGSAGPVSLDDLSASALRGLIAELPPRQRNRFIQGTLTVHYAARDVGFAMDGESALRMLAVLAGTSNDMDDIRASSDAQRVWLMIDRTDVLGAQWVPAEATVPRRATMDPGGLIDAIG